MKDRAAIFLFASLLLIFCLVAATPTRGQAHALNVQNCFSPLLVTQESSSSETDWEYYYLAMIDERTFTTIKNSGKASLANFFSGDYESFQEQRRSYFELHNESMKYYRAMSSNVSYLPPSWQPTIQKCIADTLKAAEAGLTYFVVNTQPGKFRLEIKYVSSEKNVAGPNVTSSEIDGGYVTVDGTQRRTLYLPCPEPNQTASNCPKIDSRSEFIVVRDDPNKPVSILLNLSNEKQSTSFDVDIVPKKINCTSTYEGSKRRTATLKPVPAKLSEATYGSGGYESTIWTARAVAPGKVIALVDWTYDDATNMHFLNANDDQIRAARIAAMRYRQVDINTNPFFKDDLVLIVGTQNGGPAKTITMTVDYELPVSSCHEEDWVVDQPRQKLTLH